jgi:hypothetical protein
LRWLTDNSISKESDAREKKILLPLLNPQLQSHNRAQPASLPAQLRAKNTVAGASLIFLIV